MTHFRNILAVLDPVRQRTQRKGLYFAPSLVTGVPVGKDSGEGSYLCHPSAIVFPVKLNLQHAILGPQGTAVRNG